MVRLNPCVMAELIEVAKTGRSRCRVCRAVIASDTLRFGDNQQAFGFEGTTTAWFHLECAAIKKATGFLRALHASRLQFEQRAVLEATAVIARARKSVSSPIVEVLWRRADGESFIMKLSAGGFALVTQLKNVVIEGGLDEGLASVPEADFHEAVRVARPIGKR